jgi:hypothetical protein
MSWEKQVKNWALTVWVVNKRAIDIKLNLIFVPMTGQLIPVVIGILSRYDVLLFVRGSIQT